MVAARAETPAPRLDERPQRRRRRLADVVAMACGWIVAICAYHAACLVPLSFVLRAVLALLHEYLLPTASAIALLTAVRAVPPPRTVAAVPATYFLALPLALVFLVLVVLAAREPWTAQ